MTVLDPSVVNQWNPWSGNIYFSLLYLKLTGMKFERSIWFTYSKSIVRFNFFNLGKLQVLNKLM